MQSFEACPKCLTRPPRQNDCVETIGLVGSSAPAGEDAVISIRLSGDGRTLWINDQSSQKLTGTISVRVDNQSAPASSCPVAPNWVQELSFDHGVDAVTLWNFGFRDTGAGGSEVTEGEEWNPDCSPH